MLDFWLKDIQLNARSSATEDDIQFYNQNDAYQTFQSEPNIIPLSQIAFLKLAGSEAQSFLQGQFTCDFSEQKTDHLLLGAHCSAKGKIQNFYRIVCCHWLQEPTYLLLSNNSTLLSAIDKLKKFAMFSKVSIEDKTNELASFVVYGEQTIDIMAKALSVTLPEINKVKWLEDTKTIIIRLRGEQPRFLVVADKQALATHWHKMAALCRPNNSNLWPLTEIRAGIPVIYPDTMDTFFPHYLNLPTLNAVSFEKGCYIGQEVIARMQYRGKVKQHLHRAYCHSTDQPPNPGEQIICVQDKQSIEVGKVVMAANTRQDEFELLLTLKDEYQDFNDLHLNNAKGPKLQHLNLTYSGA